jgi:hypothetical protein
MEEDELRSVLERDQRRWKRNRDAFDEPKGGKCGEEVARAFSSRKTGAGGKEWTQTPAEAKGY